MQEAVLLRQFRIEGHFDLDHRMLDACEFRAKRFMNLLRSKLCCTLVRKSPESTSYILHPLCRGETGTATAPCKSPSIQDEEREVQNRREANPGQIGNKKQGADGDRASSCAG